MCIYSIVKERDTTQKTPVGTMSSSGTFYYSYQTSALEYVTRVYSSAHRSPESQFS